MQFKNKLNIFQIMIFLVRPIWFFFKCRYFRSWYHISSDSHPRSLESHSYKTEGRRYSILWYPSWFRRRSSRIITEACSRRISFEISSRTSGIVENFKYESRYSQTARPVKLWSMDSCHCGWNLF